MKTHLVAAALLVGLIGLSNNALAQAQVGAEAQVQVGSPPPPPPPQYGSQGSSGGGGRRSSGLQTSGAQQWPGKIQLGVHPLGVGVFFVGNGGGGGVAAYKFNFDIAGKIADLSKLTIWLGGEFNIGGQYRIAIIEPGIFVRFTLEKLLHIPLVPMVQAGISGNAIVFYDVNSNNATSGGIVFKFGGGVHYYLTKNVGLGVQTDFGLGAALQPINGGGIASGFFGYWDFLAGGQFAF